MNITRSADAQVVEKSRRLDRQKDTSLNPLIRDYLELLVGSKQTDSTATEFRQLALERWGRSSPGFCFDREQANARG